MAGTIHDKGYMAFNRLIGKAAPTGFEGTALSLEINSIVPTAEPMIINSDGRTWVLSWDEIIALAVQAFNGGDASPWDGKGIPPAGTVCEVQNGVGHWAVVEITAIGRKHILFAPEGLDEERWIEMDAKFRPLQSVQELAL